MKKVLILMAHPTKNSFNNYLAKAYQNKLVEKGFDVKKVDLIDLNFELISTLNNCKNLEADLVKAQQDILWADEIVFFYPLWWSNVPALLKGFIDRVFIPNFAYKYHQNDPFWDKLLKGKKARIFSTCDAPKFFIKLMYKNADFTFLKKAVCSFTGIKVLSTKRIGNVHKLNLEQRQATINKIIAKIK